MNKMEAVFCTVLLLCCAAYVNGETSNSTKKIRILVLLPYPNQNANPLLSPSWYEAANIVPAMKLAVEHVKQREGMLDGYELELVHRDGGCDVISTTSEGLVSGLFAEKSVVGMIGPGCSASTLAVLSAVGTRNRTSLIAVHGAGSPAINRAAFPNSFGILGSASLYVDVLFAVMNQSGWRNIAILGEATRPFFTDTMKLFKQNLPMVFPESNILFSAFLYDSYIPLVDLNDTSSRVVFVFAGYTLTQQIMCLALRIDMLYPRYQWVFSSRSFEEVTNSDIVFNYDGISYNCSSEELANTASNSSFFLNYRLARFDEDESTISGLTHREYFQQYNASVVEHNLKLGNDSISVSIWATYFYDAVWTWAIVLDKVTKSGSLNIAQYQFHHPSDALIEQFEQIDFEGVSGHIKFDSETGLVHRTIDVFRAVNGTAEYVAYYKEGELIKLTGDMGYINDSFPVVLFAINPAVAAAISLPLLVQCVVLLATQVATVVHRHAKPIKASSPNLTHLGYIGAYLLVIGFFTSTVDYSILSKEGPNAACQVTWAFFFSYGFTLAFGTIAVRTFRLYRIFVHVFKPGGRILSEPALICIVLVLLSVNIIVSIVWTCIDSLTSVHTFDTSDIVNPVLHQQCTSDYYFVWLALLFGYAALQLIALSVLVCLTRNIDRNYFRTVTLQVLVYGTFGIMGTGLPLFYIATLNNQQINYVFTALGVTLNLMLLLYYVCALLPPVVLLIRQKRAQKQEVHKTLL